MSRSVKDYDKGLFCIFFQRSSLSELVVESCKVIFKKMQQGLLKCLTMKSKTWQCLEGYPYLLFVLICYLLLILVVLSTPGDALMLSQPGKMIQRKGSTI